MIKTFKKGFTLIELLMVIAVIGFFAAIVLGSLTSSRTKGADAGVKSNLSAMRAAADLFFDNNNASYGTFLIASCPSSVTGTSLFGNQSIINSINAAAASGNGTSRCVASGSAYAIAVGMKTTGQSWCIDSLGRSRQYAGDVTSAITGTACN